MVWVCMPAQPTVKAFAASMARNRLAAYDMPTPGFFKDEFMILYPLIVSSDSSGAAVMRPGNDFGRTAKPGQGLNFINARKEKGAMREHPFRGSKRTVADSLGNAENVEPLRTRDQRCINVPVSQPRCCAIPAAIVATRRYQRPGVSCGLPSRQGALPQCAIRCVTPVTFVVTSAVG